MENIKFSENEPDSSVEAKKPKNLEEYVESISVELENEFKESGIKLTGDCHIKMESYEKIFGDRVGHDIREVKEQQNKWQGKKPSKKEKIREGEKMEIFKTALFNKVLKNDFLVLRSSLYDDYKNGIDNIIFDKESGTVVGAFDEVVSETAGPVYEQKKSKIAAKNSRAGGYLKYGLAKKGDKIIMESNARVPVFYLALSQNELKEALVGFEVSDNLSEAEEIMLEKLAKSISEQIKSLENIPLFKQKIPAVKKLELALLAALK